jgi:hypothetical protein
LQLDPIEPTLKAPGTKRLELKYDSLLKETALNFKLRRYNLDAALALLQFPVVLGNHPEDGKEVIMNVGHFGWYVTHDSVNANLNKKVLAAVRDNAVAAARGGLLREIEDEDDDADAADDDIAPWDRAGAGLSGASEGEEEGEEEVAAEEVAEGEEAEEEAVDVFAREAFLYGGEEALDDGGGKGGSGGGGGGRGSGEAGGGGDGGEGEGEAMDEEKAKDAAARAAEQERAVRAAVFRAQLTPVSLEQAVDVLAAKRARPPRATRSGNKPKLPEKKPLAKSKSKSKSTSTSKPTSKSKVAVVAKAKVKRPPSSFMMYCAEARGSLPAGLKMSEQAKQMGAMWNALVGRCRLPVSKPDFKPRLVSALETKM